MLCAYEEGAYGILRDPQWPMRNAPHGPAPWHPVLNEDQMPGVTAR